MYIQHNKEAKIEINTNRVRGGGQINSNKNFAASCHLFAAVGGASPYY